MGHRHGATRSPPSAPLSLGHPAAPLLPLPLPSRSWPQSGEPPGPFLGPLLEPAALTSKVLGEDERDEEDGDEDGADGDHAVEGQLQLQLQQQSRQRARLVILLPGQDQLLQLLARQQRGGHVGVVIDDVLHKRWLRAASRRRASPGDGDTGTGGGLRGQHRQGGGGAGCLGVLWGAVGCCGGPVLPAPARPPRVPAAPGSSSSTPGCCRRAASPRSSAEGSGGEPSSRVPAVPGHAQHGLGLGLGLPPRRGSGHLPGSCGSLGSQALPRQQQRKAQINLHRPFLPAERSPRRRFGDGAGSGRGWLAMHGNAGLQRAGRLRGGWQQQQEEERAAPE